MDMTYVIAVVVTGLSVVFLALILLVFIITILGKIFTKLDENKKNKPSQNQPTEQKKTTHSPIVKEASVIDDEDEIIAVITSAINMMAEADGKKYQIKSVKPSRKHNPSGGRSVWSLAGLRENTSPF